MSEAIRELQRLIDDDDPDLQAALVDALTQQRRDVRVFAGLRLAELFQDVRAVPALAEALESGSRREQAAAGDALWEIGDADASGLLKALYHAPISARDAIAEALYRIGWAPDDVDSAVAYYTTTQRWRECILLGPDAVPALMSALADWEGSVRRGAAWVLGEIGDARAVAGLIDLLGDTEGDLFGDGARVCDIAAESLAKIGTEEAWYALDAWRASQHEDG